MYEVRDAHSSLFKHGHLFLFLSDAGHNQNNNTDVLQIRSNRSMNPNVKHKSNDIGHDTSTASTVTRNCDSGSHMVYICLRSVFVNRDLALSTRTCCMKSLRFVASLDAQVVLSETFGLLSYPLVCSQSGQSRYEQRRASLASRSTYNRLLYAAYPTWTVGVTSNFLFVSSFLN